MSAGNFSQKAGQTRKYILEYDQKVLSAKIESSEQMLHTEKKNEEKRNIMRKPYGKLILVLAAMALVTGGCQKKGNAMETDASTEAAVTESVTASEPVSEETWSWLVQTYKLLEANYETGQKLVENGLATQTEDPEEVIAEAKRLLDYGEQCGKEDMMEEDGQDLLYDMVNASNRLMDLIEKNGGTVVTMDEVISWETAAAPAAEASTDSEGEAAAPDADSTQETQESAPDDAEQESTVKPDAAESQAPADGQ